MAFKVPWPRWLTLKRQMMASLLIVFAAGAVIGLEQAKHLAIVVAAAVVADLVLVAARKEKLFFPESAIITGLLCGFILDYTTTIYAAGAAVLGILSKHALKIRLLRRHLFNPAAFGVTVATVAGVAAQSWWATTNVWAIAVAGLILAFRLRRLPMVVAFWLVNLAFLFLSNPALLSAPPVSWFNPAILFLSLFMLTEPVTGPKSKEASIAYGVLLALFIPLAGLFAGAASVTLALLLTNLFAAPLDLLVLIVKMKGMMKKMLKSVGGPVK